jgi:recombination associated protein RdgC
MFRNLRLFTLESPWPESEAELSEALGENAFRPCGPLSEQSAGWEPPTPLAEDAEDAPLCRRVAGADLLQLRTQSRVLPAAAVREALQERVARFRERTRVDPPARELRRLKMETRDELLGKALLKSERSRACFLRRERLLAVEAATASKGEWFLDQLRPCLRELRCKPFEPGVAADVLMRRMFLGKLPAGFALGDECRLQSPLDAKSIGAWRHVDLTDPLIQRHVTEGMRLTHLGLVFEDSASFVLAEDGSLGKFRLLQSDGGEEAEEDALARQDADFALFAGTIRRLVETLRSAGG